MTQYILGTPEDRADIIDFINFVFSQAHNPHDFKTLIPKVYGDHLPELAADHYLAKQDGKIKAAVANRIINISAAGTTLKAGLIGSVSVHPYSRGEGHMKQLMNMATEESRNNGVDILMLGGQRQRYEYFGFEPGGSCIRFDVTKTNLRHCFKDVDSSGITFCPMSNDRPKEIALAKKLYERRIVHTLRPKENFVDILHTWTAKCYVIYKNGSMIGYTYDNFCETELEQESDYPAVLKAGFEALNLDRINLRLAPYETERAAFLSRICEGFSIHTVELINILNWKRVLQASLSIKAATTLLADGELTVRIDNSTYRIIVANGTPTVTESNENPEIIMSHNEAQLAFFGCHTGLFPDHRLSWLAPLPLYLDAPDAF